MNAETKPAKPQIKDMPIEDAKAFIDSGLKALPYLAATPYPTIADGADMGVYAALHTAAINHPALLEDFGTQMLSFLESHAHWTHKVLPHLFVLAEHEPKLASAVIDAAFDALLKLKGLEGGGLAYSDSQFAQFISGSLIKTAKKTDATGHLIQKGLAFLSASINSTGIDYVVASTLFRATKGDDAGTRTVVLALNNALPAIREKSVYHARDVVDLIVENVGAQPQLLADILEEASLTLQAVTRARRGDVDVKGIGKMLEVAKDDPALRRNIVNMGQDVVRAGHEVNGYGSERLFATLYRAGKDDPAQLPGLIVTAWEYILPSFSGATPSRFIQEMINDSRNNPDIRNAHIEHASFAVMKIADGDSWHVHSSLKLLRDVLNLQDERRVLSSAFAIAKFDRGRNEREIWFIPKDGDMLVVQGHAVSSINAIARQKAFATIPKLDQLGRIISGVFFSEMTLDEGRREIRKETGMRFETPR